MPRAARADSTAQPPTPDGERCASGEFRSVQPADATRPAHAPEVDVRADS